MKIIHLRSKLENDPRLLKMDQDAYETYLTNNRDFIDFIQDLPVIFVETGGVEEQFKEMYLTLPEPYILVATNANNSLPAALEISSFLKDQNKKFLLLHGSKEEVVRSIKSKRASNQSFAINQQTKILDGKRYGIIGKPSDWLIASNVDAPNLYQTLGVRLVDIPFSEFKDEIDQAKNIVDPIIFEHLLNKKVTKETLDGALKIYSAIRSLMKKYELDGVTVRCFDLLGTMHNTSCLALAMLNKDGYIATCEGDVPTMLTMAFIREAFHQSSFQVNPSYVNILENYAYFAHCTLPLDMCLDYSFDTHFESGLGIGIRGRLNLGKVTIMKINRDFTKYHVTEGKITANLGQNNLCRSQNKVEFEQDISRFLSEPFGNHLVIFYGSHADEVREILK